MLKVIFITLCQWMPAKHAEIATKQAVLESGWCSSEAYEECCNPFGLMWKGRIQEFESIEDACHEYYLQIYKQYKGGDYYEFLTRMGYAGDSLYTDKLKHINLHGILYDRAEEQCNNSLHGRTSMAQREILQGVIERGVRTDRPLRLKVPLIMGLAYTSMGESKAPINPWNDYRGYRSYGFRRHRKVAHNLVERLHQLVQGEQH